MAENLREQNTEKMGAGNQFVKLIPRFAFTAFLAVVLLAVSACLKTCLGRRGGASEDPVELVLRSGICLFFIVNRNHDREIAFYPKNSGYLCPVSLSGDLGAQRVFKTL